MGRERVHVRAPTAERVAGEMDRFLDWFNAATDLDPVLKAAVAHFRFITIHPFEDGNGRIARAIADLALARGDGTPDRFYSMSARIEAERAQYSMQLESAQRGSTDITAWIAWFLGCLERAIDSADGLLAPVLRKARLWQSLQAKPVNKRQRLVLNRMLGDWQGFLTTATYATLATCSPDTAQRDMKELVEGGALVQNAAGGRSTSYRLSDRV